MATSGNAVTMSKRGFANIESIMPRINDQVTERQKVKNHNIDLSSAENWLIRPELVEICKDAIQKDLTDKHLSYPDGFSGHPYLLSALSNFFNSHFHPHRPVEPHQLAITPGAAGCIDAIVFNICNPGEGVLVPAPYWNGFDFLFEVRSSVVPIAVKLPDLASTLTLDLIPALEAAYQNATVPVRALMITNPHNPIGQCYSRSVLEACVKFCAKADIHLIFDEVYAMTSFPCPELVDPPLFVSGLALDIEALGGKPNMVHVIWSSSKDFGQSGVRMGCIVTQSNKELHVGLALAANTQTSSLSAIFLSELLNSPRLSSLLQLNSERLEQAYTTLTSFFKKHSIPYIPAYAGLYVFARFVPDAVEWEDESRMLARIKEVGVLLSAGKNYHGPEGEKGWFRVGFAFESSVLDEALRRMEKVFEDR